jgi:uncharacterized damage-inducible protein DinB
MESVASSTPASNRAMPGPRQQFLDAFEREHATTLRVLRAYPAAQVDLRPHPKSKSARELAWIFVAEQSLAQKALTTGFDWSAPPASPPPPPESLDAIIAAFDEGHRRVADLVRDLRDEQFGESVRFFVAPKSLGDIPKIEFLWFLLCDQIHHRGQLSVYLRLAGGKVPSIYGPTADEPWM